MDRGDASAFSFWQGPVAFIRGSYDDLPITRNYAEARPLAMMQNNWKPETLSFATKEHTTAQDATTENTDLEELARDQIAQAIMARFKGHGLTRILKRY